MDPAPKIAIQTGSLTPISYAGYKFDHISTTSVEGDEIASGSEIILYYVKDSFKLSYVFEDGFEVPTGVTVPADETREFEEEFDLATMAVVEGFEFSGWREKKVPTVATGEKLRNLFNLVTGAITANADVYEDALTSFKMPDHDVVMEGHFTRLSYTVSYRYSNGASGASALPTAKSYKYGETVTVAPNATASGYRFSGWSGAGTGAGSTFTMPAHDVELVGSWTANPSPTPDPDPDPDPNPNPTPDPTPYINPPAVLGASRPAPVALVPDQPMVLGASRSPEEGQVLGVRRTATGDESNMNAWAAIMLMAAAALAAWLERQRRTHR